MKKKKTKNQQYINKKTKMNVQFINVIKSRTNNSFFFFFFTTKHSLTLFRKCFQRFFPAIADGFGKPSRWYIFKRLRYTASPHNTF